jgi:hypothetical protein
MTADGVIKYNEIKYQKIFSQQLGVFSENRKHTYFSMFE